MRRRVSLHAQRDPYFVPTFQWHSHLRTKQQASEVYSPHFTQPQTEVLKFCGPTCMHANYKPILHRRVTTYLRDESYLWVNLPSLLLMNGVSRGAIAAEADSKGGGSLSTRPKAASPRCSSSPRTVLLYSSPRRFRCTPPSSHRPHSRPPPRRTNARCRGPMSTAILRSVPRVFLKNEMECAFKRSVAQRRWDTRNRE